ncbi:RagB/SusD family nutrient uptake outer membrane protein [Maribellus comscasis]|uniref:RagB/SusD family nutrient uptake outer membrane protein n=1 Tax=Maribellus comscasis TaxID=2681766 RepID=A0A6I6JJV5_9BACT|nr:RagB/SusD family nutrient uptake outer membrane protein [Maribellus comscasis]QGY42561.1 RagB/SusD family nutrient uptake outer membrane protein [Maribellus comscasis]
MKRYFLLLLIIFSFVSCDNLLEEEVYSSLGPSNFYSTAEDAESLLNSAYTSRVGNVQRICMGEAPTEIFMERKGGIYAYFRPMEEFSWNSSHNYLLNAWTQWYTGIFKTNTILDHVPSIDMDEDRKEQILAEARFLRAFFYFSLYDYWGPVPLILTSDTYPSDRPSRPSDDEFVEFVESEFIACSEVLPWTQDEFPRASKGAALGFLTKFYLNNHKWSLAAETAKEIIDSEVHELFKGGTSRADLFDIENEGNSEMIYVQAYSSQNPSNGYHSHAVPDNYTWKYNTLTNYAADFRIPDSFLDTFDPEDQRLDAFIFKYLSTSGDSITLRGTDNVRSFKFPEDPNALGHTSSNDFPLLRYADILLSRAEALNEISGPTQESVDLINEVREAAGISDLQLADYTQETFRDAILAERSWEFHTEGLRRQDLIRQERFISDAVDRGWSAEDYMVLYPIPQSEMDANPNLIQNEGYN